jgi:arylsulfatase A-like enzyme
VVVFTADHGDMMGAHRLMEKGHWLHYEEDLRVPLIVRHPDGRQSRNANFVSLVDIAATIGELAGVRWDEAHDGRSFAAMIGNDAAEPTREYVTAETMLRDGRPGGNGDAFHAKDWQYPRDSLNLSVRTAGHRYVFRSHDEAELYDLATDPWEQNNLAATTEGAATAKVLAGLLADEVTDVLPDAAALVRKSV